MGWYAARLGDCDIARVHCQAALALHQHHNNRAGEADTLDSLGYIDHHTGHHRQAIHHYEQALTLSGDLGNNYAAANVLDRLAQLRTALGQHELARTMWRKALELYQEQGRDDDAAPRPATTRQPRPS